MGLQGVGVRSDTRSHSARLGPLADGRNESPVGDDAVADKVRSSPTISLPPDLVAVVVPHAAAGAISGAVGGQKSEVGGTHDGAHS